MTKVSATERRGSHLTDDPAVVERKLAKLVKDIEAGLIVPQANRVRDAALRIARPAMRAGFERGFSPLYVRQIMKEVGAVILIKEIKIEYDAWLADKTARGEVVPPVTKGTLKGKVIESVNQGKTTGSIRTESEYVSASDFAEATLRVGDIPPDDDLRESYVESVVASLCSAAEPKLASSLDVTEVLEPMVVYASDLHGGRMQKAERAERRQTVLARARPGIVSVETLEALLSGPLGDRG